MTAPLHRDFASVKEMDDAFGAWLPLRWAEVRRTHVEVISVRTERDGPPWAGFAERSYVVVDRHLRSVGKDCFGQLPRPACIRCRGGRCAGA